ncbi:hypothetical protein [Microbulbifer halophilus]|uniref:VCBS repeat-containing protein n=1 Tax=Microbulbifer halophilus TaxID=453963 RepID=A0ABW5EH55_9GAMM|nr:hypothetical protein [Microbulbifer halophilus]MCW8128401.1 hypothetical protein [Microbulbifer halophilus]
MRCIFSLVATVLLLSCAAEEENSIEKSISTDQITGLTNLGNSYQDVQLEYALDGRDGNLVKFSSCRDVDKTADDAIREDQYPLLTMLRANCKALELYFNAQNASKSHLPEKITSDFVRNLPASATPNLGGDRDISVDKTLAETFPKIKATEIGTGNVQAQFDDLDINYIALARGDFDRDGVEDMLLRLDWQVTSAFGNGFDLLLVGVNAKHNIVILESK